MPERFLKVLWEMSYQAGIAVCVVLCVRFVFERLQVPKKFACLLWMLPLLRMILPWTVSSSISLYGLIGQLRNTEKNGLESLPEAVTSPSATGNDVSQSIFKTTGLFQASGAGQIGAAVSTGSGKASVISGSGNVSVIPGSGDTVSQTVDASQDISRLLNRILESEMSVFLCVLWAAGLALLLGYGIFSWHRLRKQLACSVCVGGNLYLADHVETPFVMGFLKPRIYFPSDLGKAGEGADQSDYTYILAHEQAHISRRDPIMKLFAYGAVCVHWFNPFAWLAFWLLGRDMEMACDELVLGRMGLDKRQEYASVLLKWTADDRTGQGRWRRAPLAFGEENPKKRIRHIMNCKKTAAVFAIAAAAVLLLLAGVLLTVPGEEGGPAGQEESLAAGAPETEEILGIELPVVTRETITGDGIRLEYADDDRIIFRAGGGLFVYSLKEGEMTDAVALKPIGCDATQGDDYCEVLVSPKGDKVYLHPLTADSMYVYDVEKL